MSISLCSFLDEGEFDDGQDPRCRTLSVRGRVETEDLTVGAEGKFFAFPEDCACSSTELASVTLTYCYCPQNEEMVTEGELRSNLDDSEKVRELQDKVADMKAEVCKNCVPDCLAYMLHSAAHISACDVAHCMSINCTYVEQHGEGSSRCDCSNGLLQGWAIVLARGPLCGSGG
jgi:hypothetical protein